MDAEQGRAFAATLRSTTTIPAFTARMAPTLAPEVQHAKSQALAAPMYPRGAFSAAHASAPEHYVPQADHHFPAVKRRGAMGRTNRFTDRAHYAGPAPSTTAPLDPCQRREGANLHFHTSRYAATGAGFAAPPAIGDDDVHSFRHASGSASLSSSARLAVSAASPAEDTGDVLVSPRAPRTLRRITQLPWSRRDQKPGWLNSATANAAAHSAAAAATATGSSATSTGSTSGGGARYSAEDQAAVRVALSALSAQVGSLNRRGWFRDVNLPSGLSRTLAPAELTVAVAQLGVPMTDKQQELLAELFYGGAARAHAKAAAARKHKHLQDMHSSSSNSSKANSSNSSAAGSPQLAPLASPTDAAGTSAADEEDDGSAYAGRPIDFLHLVSRLKGDRGVPPEAELYPQRMAHLRTAAKVARPAWPRFSAERALALFREHMGQRRAREALRSIGVVDRISYDRLARAVGDLNIPLAPGEGARLARLLDKDNKGHVAFEDIFPPELLEAGASAAAGTVSVMGDCTLVPERAPIGAAARARVQAAAATEGSAAAEDVNTHLTPAQRESIPPLLQRGAAFLHAGAAAPAAVSATVGRVLQSVTAEQDRRYGAARSRDPATGAVTRQTPADAALLRPSRYGLTYEGRLNSARTVAPLLDAPELPYAAAESSGSNHACSAQDRFRPRADAIRAMQDEDAARRHRVCEAKAVIHAARVKEAEDGARREDEVRAQRDEEKRLGIVSTRMRYYDALGAQSHARALG